MDIYNSAREYGKSQATNQGMLSKLGLDALRAAVNRQISSEDARGLYETYYKASHPHISGQSSGYDTGMKANVSKLRQLILLGERHRKAAIALMERAADIYRDLSQKSPVRPFYPYLVEVARAQLGQNKPISDSRLVKLCAKPPTSRKK
jgi:hypothetical protein